MTRKHGFPLWAVLTLAIGLPSVGLAALCGVGAMWLAKSPPQAQASQTKAKLPTRDEFRAKWIGKTKNEVLAGLGKPTRTIEVEGRQIWYYGPMAYDPISGKTDSSVSISFPIDGDKVTRIAF